MPGGRPFPWLIVGIGIAGLGLCVLTVGCVLVFVFVAGPWRVGPSAAASPSPAGPPQLVVPLQSTPSPVAGIANPTAVVASGPVAVSTTPGRPVAVVAPAVEMLTFEDPYGQFSISYPARWKVTSRSEGKMTDFYPNSLLNADSLEGELFSILVASIDQRRAATAADVFGLLVEGQKGRYPDFAIVFQSVRPVAKRPGDPPELAEVLTAEAIWTNPQGFKIKLHTELRCVMYDQQLRTAVTGISYQGPVDSFGEYQVLFERMHESLKWLV